MREFDSYTKVFEHLKEGGVDSHDFIVRKTMKLLGDPEDWEVVITNPAALEAIKGLIEDSNIKFTIQPRKPRLKANLN